MKKWIIYLMAVTLIVTSFLPVSQQVASARQEPVPLVVVSVESESDIQELINAGLDIADIDPVNLEVTIVLGNFEKQFLDSNDYSFDILVEDLNVPAESDIEKPLSIFSVLKSTERTDYRNIDEFYEEIAEIAEKYPELVRVEEIGRSVEGRPIHAIEISSTPGQKDGKPESVHMASHHAREWPTGELAMDLAWYLVDNYGSDTQVDHIVDNVRTWIIPMVNPDGFVWSQESFRMWRKNRKNNENGTFGVDPNRNYSYLWGGNGSSGVGSSETYRGIAPFSEPETAAIRDFYLDRNIVTTITGHTYGQLILYPWGNTTDPMRASDQFIAEMGAEMAKWNNYTDQPAMQLYATHGDTVDWIYGAMRGIAFTYEYGKEFIPPYEGYRSTVIDAGGHGEFDFNTFTFSVDYTGTSGKIIHAGKGLSAADFPAEVAGNIALIERGDISFRDKALNAAAAGASGVIIYNNTTGTVSGTLSSSGVPIPVVGITRADGVSLVNKLNAGEEVTASLQVSNTPRDSYKQLWEMSLPPFLYNIEKAAEHASTLEGQVVDKTTGEEVKATLELDLDFFVPQTGVRSGQSVTESQHVTLDTDGSFVWNVLPSEQPDYDTPPYLITAKAAGYYDAATEVEVKEFGEKHNIDFHLQPVAKVIGASASKESWNPNATIPFKFETFDHTGETKAMKDVKVKVLNGDKVVATYSEGKGASAIRSDVAGEYIINIQPRSLGLQSGTYSIIIEFTNQDTIETLVVPIEVGQSNSKGKAA
ncbi:M14 family zinc carboxypeptidase [Halalkalibacter akibai]|uniref:carboxypeptidase T n=1 Tax=Halalkalibacter akibai (strain ATCC 43226 / DSM 21942 / CIP 109018 / JCM 9157 / 1139) TaxID=1236973 RepID=W4QSH8_HALA3|nr:M14 family zinc carboxypeptidase [Halalkalibacter akibai]GAE34289.1 carboxypeptidase T precursor [Halalkalibacter akibai JCM 9157]